MLEQLSAVEDELRTLLAEADPWQSLRIDYHPPVVERVWRPWRDLRLSLHRIHPCGPGEALLHPHPWPSAVLIIEGEYEMGVTYGAGSSPPPLGARIVLGPGARYEMTEPDAWHYVRPLGRPSLSIMVTGAPWSRAMPLEPEHPLKPMKDAERNQLIAAFALALSARGST
ncbi:MAG: hypothetical protein HS111_09905 [Kofleriaceae bacterium]|nr:hypothetical protein [Kofleriaceae bacterium]